MVMLTSLVGARSCGILPIGRHQAAPVRQQNQDEERGEDRVVAPRALTAYPDREIPAELVGPLDHVLEAARDHLQAARRADPEQQDRSAITIHIVRIVLLMLGWK